MTTTAPRTQETREALDFYPTPEWVGREGIREAASLWLSPLCDQRFHVLEPCAGTGHLSRLLEREPWVSRVTTGDLVQRPDAPRLDHQWDFLEAVALGRVQRHDAIITNPPYNDAPAWVRACLEVAPRVALLLPVTFLEPADNRAQLLEERPPALVQILPRPSFRGDGGSDARTVAWFFWTTPNPYTTRVQWTHPRVRQAARDARRGQLSLALED